MRALDVGLELGLGEGCLEGESGILMYLDSEEGSGSIADLETEQASHYMHMETVCSRKMPNRNAFGSVDSHIHLSKATWQRGKKANGRRLWMKIIYASL